MQNSLLGWAAKGLPFVLAENRERAARIVEQFLSLAARRAWKQSRRVILSLGKAAEEATNREPEIEGDCGANESLHARRVERS